MVAGEALNGARVRDGELLAVGIANQRETVCVWDPATGEPLYRAIVWQDRRTAARCDELRDLGHEGLIRARTGLVLDPIFRPPRSSGCSSTWRACASVRTVAARRARAVWLSCVLHEAAQRPRSRIRLVRLNRVLAGTRSPPGGGSARSGLPARRAARGRARRVTVAWRRRVSATAAASSESSVTWIRVLVDGISTVYHIGGTKTFRGRRPVLGPRTEHRAKHTKKRTGHRRKRKG